MYIKPGNSQGAVHALRADLEDSHELVFRTNSRSQVSAEVVREALDWQPSRPISGLLNFL